MLSQSLDRVPVSNLNGTVWLHPLMAGNVGPGDFHCLIQSIRSSFKHLAGPRAAGDSTGSSEIEAATIGLRNENQRFDLCPRFMTIPFACWPTSTVV